MSNSVDSAVSEILLEGLDDWVPVDRVVGEAREIADGSGVPVPEVAAVVITRLIESGYMVPGDIGDDGFRAWEGAPAELAGRVVRECEELHWEPYGEGCWLANTATGDRVAESGAV